MLGQERVNILSVPSRTVFLRFLADCEHLSVDSRRISDIAKQTIAHLNKTKEARGESRALQALEMRWYDALMHGETDYSVYCSEDYLAELWACWAVYSRKYLNNLWTKGILDELKPVQGVVDLGCGIGYTTAALAGIFRDAPVSGTNLDGTIQTDFAGMIGMRYGFAVVPAISELSHEADVVFAFEYFEHIPNPIVHLYEIVTRLNPRALFIANSFGTSAIGHFGKYTPFDGVSDPKDTSRLFGKKLRDWGYEKIKTGLWNDRPAYWRKSG